jgi:hypothetical protein
MAHPPILLRRYTQCILAGMILATMSWAAKADDCEALTGSVLPHPKSLVTYQLPDLSGVELLARDGSRVPIRRGDALAPKLTLDGVLPPWHWANAADVALYHSDAAETRYLFAPRVDGLRLCRIEHRPPDDGGSIERLEYDNAGRIVGWQQMSYKKRKWQVDEHRCFIYNGGGRLTGYAKAKELLDCGDLRPEQIQLSYVYDTSGRMTRVIDRDSFPRNLEEYDRPHTTVVLFNSEGRASYMIETDSQGEPIQLPVDPKPERSGESGIVPAYQPGSKIGPNVDITMTDPGGVPLPNREWQIVLVKAAVEPDDGPDRICWRDTERMLAEGTTSRDGRVQLSTPQKKQIWSLALAHPNRVCMHSGADAYLLRTAYPKENWIRCLDPQQSEASACPVR